MKPDELQYLVRHILKEEIDKKADAAKKQLRVPEMNGNGIDPVNKNKTFSTDSNSKDLKSKESLLDDLSKAVSEFKDMVTVKWDDHDDLMVNARDLKFIRISPRWTDSYVIEMMTRNDDRVWVTGQSWEQVKEFVKLNLKDLNKQPSAVEKAYDKSYRNREDQVTSPDKGLPQKDKPKIKPLTSEDTDKTKNKDKNYTEDDVKDKEDLPDRPMKEVGDVKKQIDYKVQKPVKLRKHPLDTKLKLKL